jgi:hypothetical protein
VITTYLTQMMPPGSENPSHRLLIAAAAGEQDDAANFSFRRTFAVTICVDAGEESRALGEELVDHTRRIIQSSGCSVVYSPEPLEGSHIQTLFGQTKDLETGAQCHKKLAQIRAAISLAVRELHWPHKAGHIVKVVVLVGTIATIFVASGAGITVGTFLIPYSVLLALVGNPVDLGREMHALVFDSDASKTAKESNRG